MESERPYITKRPHTKSRNGCSECKRRKQKCDEVQPQCGHCKRRNVNCQYGPRIGSRSSEAPSFESQLSQRIRFHPSKSIEIENWRRPGATSHPQGIIEPSTTKVEEVDSTDSDSGWSKLFSSSYSGTESHTSGSTKAKSPELSIVPGKEIAQDDWFDSKECAVILASIPSSIQKVPWQNSFERKMYDAFYTTHKESMSKLGMDDATKEIWLDLVPKIALNSEGALFPLLLSFGSLHAAFKSVDTDCPYFRRGTKAAKLWESSMCYFSEAVSNFRLSIISGQVFETNPEVFCVTALVLASRMGLNINHNYTDVEDLYSNTLSWYTSTLGYIDLGGFFNQKLQNTQLGDIMKANPQATYHFYPFLESIKSQDLPYFEYLHPMNDPTGNVDPRDLTEEALHAYTMSIKLIGWVYQAAIYGALKSDVFSMFHVVPYMVPKHLLVLLRRRRPRAIAVLAHHIALQGFLGAYEHLQFWPREHINLLREIVPPDWTWTLRKAIQVVEEGESRQTKQISSIHSTQLAQPAQTV